MEEEKYGIFICGEPSESFGEPQQGLRLHTVKSINGTFPSVQEAEDYITEKRISSIVILRVY